MSGPASAAADPASVARFVEKWAGVELSERAASHEHFIDLCRLVGHPTPATADPTGADYTFEKPVKVVGVASRGSKGEGGVGFVDVWKRRYFAWEYKRKDKYKTLDEAYRDVRRVYWEEHGKDHRKSIRGATDQTRAAAPRQTQDAGRTDCLDVRQP